MSNLNIKKTYDFGCCTNQMENLWLDMIKQKTFKSLIKVMKSM